MTQFEALTYDVLSIGEEFVSDEHLVTPEDIETYAFAVEDDHPWFFGPSPFGGPVAHPTLLANQALRLRHSKYIVHAGLHARMESHFLEPIRPGVRARSRGTLIDKYERRGKQYMVTEFVTEDEGGTALVRGQFTQMLLPSGGLSGKAPGDVVARAPEKPPSRFPAGSAEAGVEEITIGQALPRLVKEVSQRRIDAYSGVRPRSIHTDEAWARQKGFRATLAQGMMSTAYVSEMMTHFAGAGFVKGGWMSVAFIKPVYAEDRLTVQGVVREKRPDNGGTRVVVEVWCENQHGEKTAVGSASGVVG
jgi:acyl dehydratase